MDPDCSSFYDEVSARLNERGMRPCLSFDGGEFSGKDVVGKVECWAGALLDLGVRPGDRVVVQAPKSPELVLLYLATLRIGGVYVPLNTSYTSSEVAYFLADAEPALFVCAPDEADAVNEVESGARFRILTLDGDGAGTMRDAADACRRDHIPFIPIAPDDLAAIIYTSGTTGRSKGAMITQRNLLSNARALVATWGIASTDVLIHALPLYHIHGLFVALNTLLLAGGEIRLRSGFDSGDVMASMSGATLFMGVPTYYSRLLSEPQLTSDAVSQIRLFISGSAPLSAATFSAFEKRTGHKILERYGMSECGIICSNPLAGERLPGAVGFPLPGVEVRLSGSGEKGVLEVRGENVFAGYWRQPEKTRTEFRDDGFFITGDVATIDADGVVRIVGREKDMIISGGLNIYPKEIEALIDAFDEVDESAVIGLPHPDFGEGVVAIIRLHAQRHLSEKAVIERLRSDLAGFKLPKAVLFVDALPRNAMAKVQKASLRADHHHLFDG